MTTAMTLKENLTRILSLGYAIAPRDPALLSVIIPGLEQRARNIDGAYMVFDPKDDSEGFLLIGDDIEGLLEDACHALTGDEAQPQRIRFNTGRRYTSKGQRIGAERIPEGILFTDVDRMIDGFIPNVELRLHNLAFDQDSIMRAYDLQLCDYWVGVLDHEDKVRALREWTREL